jgi:hypothetical protein
MHLWLIGVRGDNVFGVSFDVDRASWGDELVDA